MADEQNKDDSMPDPVSSALVLAGKGAGEVITPKLREMFLGPLAKAYGDHWGAEAEERLRKRREERRAKNAQAHIQAVAVLGPRRTFEDVSDDPIFDEWLNGAAAVDAEVDPDLANFWRAALVALAQGDTARLRLLRIVRALGPDDAVYLATGEVKAGRFRPSPQFDGATDYAQRLEKVGVFETVWHQLRRNPSYLLAAIIMPLSIYAAVSIAPYMRMINLDVEAFDRLAFPIAIFAFAVPAIAILQRVSVSARRLTADGRRLLAFLDTVRQGKHPSPEPEPAEPS